MASALITNRQYKNFYTGTDTSWLIGNVGDVVEMTLDIEASITFLSTYQTQVKTQGNSITRFAGSWYDEGFAVGQSVTMSFTLTNNGVALAPVTFTRNILTLTPTLMIVDGASIGTYIFPFQNSINGIDNEFSGLSIAVISFTSPFQAIELNYGLTTNSLAGSGDLSSLIDGTILTFKCNTLSASIVDPAIALTPFSFRSGGAILSATVQGKTPLLPLSTVKKYQIKVKFLITPFYDVIDDLTNKTLPSSYTDLECLTDILSVKLFPEINNPNITVSVKGSESVLKGNTGWFDENYNGGTNNYSIELVSYFNDLGVPISGIATGGKTDAIIVINQSGATSDFDYKLGFIWTPSTPSFYSKKLTGHHENLMYNGCGDLVTLKSTTPFQTFTGYTNDEGARMDIDFKSITFTATQVTIRVAFSPNSEVESFFTDKDVSNLNYAIWVSVGNEVAVNLSDRVSLLASFKAFTLPAVITEQYNVTNSFLGHAQESNQIGAMLYGGCVEDEITARSIIRVDNTLDETIQEMTFTIEGRNIVTNENFILESNSYDCTGFVKDANNIQQINIDTTRGFVMVAGLEKNAVQIVRDPLNDNGSLKAYKGLYSFRARWEDWISRINVPSVFFDNALLNNNLNNDWGAKDDLQYWKLTYNVNIRLLRNGLIVNTKNTFDFIVKKYEESEIYDGAITTYDSTKTNNLFLGFDASGIRTNAILSTDNTWIEADFDLEDLLGDVGDINDYFGVIRLEEYRNGGLFKIEMLSSILTNTENILIPLTGQAKAKLTKVSDTKIRVEGLIDKSKLNLNNSQYKISARLGCKDINLGKYGNKYSQKYN